MASKFSFEKITTHLTSTGYVFPGSAIYGGLSNTWDYGPLGVELKNNIKKAWWQKFVTENDLNVGIDCAILMNPQTWEASGHIGGFSDPLMDCKECKSRHRADDLIEAYLEKKGEQMSIAGWSNEQMEKFVIDNQIKCPVCGKSNFTGVRKFNLMFKTFQGVTEDSLNTVYLRPETAQGIFVNFLNVQRSARMKVPFGIGQIGKSFRNEITPGNFIFRVREFEQMELEFFCKPGTDLKWFSYWKDFCHKWLLSLGIKDENLKLRDHDPDELCFYSRATTDFEFKFPFGWGELWGVADRTDYDLNCHIKKSGKNLEYLDPVTNERYVPYVVEPSLGVERTVLAVLCNAYDEEEVDGETRVVLRLHPVLAPYKVAVMPLQKKQLGDKATEVLHLLNKKFSATYDDAGSIGRRYRRQDEIGTPFCVTVDFDTLEDNSVTVRDRDTMEQVRVNLNDLVEYINSKIVF